MSKYVNEVLDGPRLYDVKTEDGLATLFSKVQIDKNYTPLVEGSNFGAKDANHFDNMITALSIDNTKIRLELELAKLDGVGFYDIFNTLDDVNESLTNADVNTTTKDVTFNVATYNITASNDYTAETTIRTNEEPSVGDKIDNTNEILTVTPFDNSVTIDVTTPEQVVASAYSTEGNGGRKFVKLDNGTLMTALFESGAGIKVYKSINDGRLWTLVHTASSASFTSVSVATDGINLFYVAPTGGSNIKFYTINESGFVGVSDIESAQTSLGFTSLAVNSDNTKITATWSSKNATYPNLFNIRAIQGTILNGVVTWGSVEQLTTTNSSGYDIITPSIEYQENDNITILSILSSSINNLVRSHTFNSTTLIWDDMKTVYVGDTYTQSNPSATFMPPEIAIKINALYTSGLSNVAWQGYGATHTSTYHIFFSKSINDGVNWLASPVDVAIGENPSTSWNNDGQLHLQYERSGVKYFKTSDDGGDNWSAESTGIVGTNANSCDNFHDFDQALTVSMGSGNVQFDGKWTVGDIVYELILQSPVTVLEGATLEVYPSTYPYETLVMNERTFKINVETVTTVLYLTSGSSADFEVYVNGVLATLLYDEELELTYQIESVDSADIIIKVNGSNSAVLDNLLFAIS